MVHVLGHRRVFGIATPSVNTVVQLEYDDLRPAGVVHHCEGIYVADMPGGGRSNTIETIDLGLEDSIRRLSTCRPDHIILGISAESIWGGGVTASHAIAERIRKIAGDLPITQAAEAIPAALETLGVRGAIAVVHPYGERGESQIRRFFDDVGQDVARVGAIPVSTIAQYAHTSPRTVVEVLKSIDGGDIAAIVQFGANLPFGRLAAAAELWLDKPVIAVNVATYWHALRSAGLPDRVDGYGSLFSHY